MDLLKIDLFIGLNDKDKKKQVIPTRKALKIIKKCINIFYNDFTLINCIGSYGSIQEKSVQVMLLINKKDNIKIDLICDMLRLKLNQESILYIESPSIIQFKED